FFALIVSCRVPPSLPLFPYTTLFRSLRVDGDGVDSHVLGGADDPHRDLAPVGDEEAFDVACHSGMFPCFFWGRVLRFVRNIRRARSSFTLVSRGSLTSSPSPSSAARYGVLKRASESAISSARCASGSSASFSSRRKITFTAPWAPITAISAGGQA